MKKKIVIRVVLVFVILIGLLGKMYEVRGENNENIIYYQGNKWTLDGEKTPMTFYWVNKSYDYISDINPNDLFNYTKNLDGTYNKSNDNKRYWNYKLPPGNNYLQVETPNDDQIRTQGNRQNFLCLKKDSQTTEMKAFYVSAIIDINPDGGVYNSYRISYRNNSGIKSEDGSNDNIAKLAYIAYSAEKNKFTWEINYNFLHMHAHNIAFNTFFQNNDDWKCLTLSTPMRSVYRR